MMMLITLVTTGSPAVLNLFAAAVKLLTPWQQLQEKMPWTQTTGKGPAYLAAWAEIVGAIGAMLLLVLAYTVDGWEWATWVALAAVIGLTIIQVLAFRLHMKRDETQNLPTNIGLIILGLVAAVLILLTR